VLQKVVFSYLCIKRSCSLCFDRVLILANQKIVFSYLVLQKVVFSYSRLDRNPGIASWNLGSISSAEQRYFHIKSTLERRQTIKLLFSSLAMRFTCAAPILLVLYCCPSLANTSPQEFKVRIRMFSQYLICSLG
jgi:hypothetical protein